MALDVSVNGLEMQAVSLDLHDKDETVVIILVLRLWAVSLTHIGILFVLSGGCQTEPSHKFKQDRWIQWIKNEFISFQY